MIDNILLAFSSLFANKMRALLTMLGIIIGIGAVIAIVTLGDSLTGSITDSMNSMGVSNITVSLQQKSSDDAGALMFGRSTPDAEDLITPAMIEDYRAQFGDKIQAVALSRQLGSGEVSNGENNATVSVTGVNSDYQTLEDPTMLSGRFVRDEDGERMVAVVSDVFVESIFPNTSNVLGRSFDVNVDGTIMRFFIVGVYEYEENGFVSMDNSDPVTTVYIPVETARRLLSESEGYESLTVMGASGQDSTTLMEQTESFFASYYTRNDSYTIAASSLESMLSTMTEMLDTVKLAVAAIAAISLLVGGIGVMNIMLVSITERTREIGVRKALGARNLDIRIQFITESVVICLVGGAFGIALGVGLGVMGANLLGTPAKPSIAAITMAAGFSMAIGVFFGYYPANKAAKLDPIEALRYE